MRPKNFDPTATDDPQNANHAWNEAYVNGKWIIIDATWGCRNGYESELDEQTGEQTGRNIWVKKPRSDLYFDCAMEFFCQDFLQTHCIIAQHTPDESYNLTVGVTKRDNCYFEIPNISGKINATAKTEEALGLPKTVKMVTPEGEKYVSVKWQLGTCSYDPSLTKAQTFTVDGITEGNEKWVIARVTVLAKGDIPVPDTLTENDIANITDSEIVIKTKSGLEYSIDGGKTWSLTGEFKGLESGTNYDIICRYSGGAASEKYTVKTNRRQTAAPAAPTLKSAGFNWIELNSCDGCEYKIEGGEWQSSNIFTRLDPEKGYTFYQRIAETDKVYQSESSAGAEFFTTKKPPYVPGNVDDSADSKITLNDVVILARVVAGWNIDYNKAAADINGDGDITLNDVVQLARYVAGWEGIVLH